MTVDWHAVRASHSCESFALHVVAKTRALVRGILEELSLFDTSSHGFDTWVRVGEYEACGILGFSGNLSVAYMDLRDESGGFLLIRCASCARRIAREVACSISDTKYGNTFRSPGSGPVKLSTATSARLDRTASIMPTGDDAFAEKVFFIIRRIVDGSIAPLGSLPERQVVALLDMYGHQLIARNWDASALMGKLASVVDAASDVRDAEIESIASILRQMIECDEARIAAVGVEFISDWCDRVTARMLNSAIDSAERPPF